MDSALLHFLLLLELLLQPLNLLGQCGDQVTGNLFSLFYFVHLGLFVPLGLLQVSIALYDLLLLLFNALLKLSLKHLYQVSVVRQGLLMFVSQCLQVLQLI